MFYWVLKAVLRPLLRTIYRIRARGLANVPTKGPAIIAANHLSFLDSLFIPLVIKRRKVIYLAKADYFTSWKTGWFFSLVGQIPTERGGGRKSAAALDVALEVLAEQKLLGIYPEGTRSPDGYIYRGRTGVARLAIAAGVPVIPVGLIGSDKAMPKAARFPRLTGRPTVELRFGEPLDFSGYAGREKDRAALRRVTDEIMAAITELSGQTAKGEYATSGRSAGKTGPVDDGDLSEEMLAG